MNTKFTQKSRPWTPHDQYLPRKHPFWPPQTHWPRDFALPVSAEQIALHSLSTAHPHLTTPRPKLGNNILGITDFYQEVKTLWLSDSIESNLVSKHRSNFLFQGLFQGRETITAQTNKAVSLPQALRDAVLWGLELGQPHVSLTRPL